MRLMPMLFEPSILVLLLLAIPIAAAIVVALMGPRVAAIRWISLTATTASLLLSLLVAVEYANFVSDHPRPSARTASRAPTFEPEFVPGASGNDSHSTTWNLLLFGPSDSESAADHSPITTHHSPLPAAIQFYVGIDGMNVWLVVLTALLTFSSVLISWDTSQVSERTNEYYAWLLTLETGMLGVFLSFDIILFYVFFELSLVPLFFLIGIWGGPQRRYAARKFFIYTLTGSLIMLLGLISIVLACHSRSNSELTFSIPRLVSIVNEALTIQDDRVFWQNVQFWVFLALMAGLAIKVPLVPLHTWLPLAHVEAPTAGSVLLAGILLKIGAYGFMRLCLPLAPDASLSFGVPVIGTLAVIGIIYGALCSLVQDDIKKLVAYSSVSHLGFCMLGMFALNLTGLSGSLLQMVNHGLSTGALFLLVGMLYERYHTRQMSDYGGMGARLGVLACFMVFISLSSLGLPGLNGFVGEALVLFGMFELKPAFSIIASSGILLGAWYLLQMLFRVFFGTVKEPNHEGHSPITDLNTRELAALVPIAVACIAIGVCPQPLLDTSRPTLEVVTSIVDKAKVRAEESDSSPGARQAAADGASGGKVQ
jgi:NADH-quinone oxidoreductase subunit M